MFEALINALKTEDAITLRDELIATHPLDGSYDAELHVEGYSLPISPVSVTDDNQWAFWTRVSFKSETARDRVIDWIESLARRGNYEKIGKTGVRLAPIFEILTEEDK